MIILFLFLEDLLEIEDVEIPKLKKLKNKSNYEIIENTYPILHLNNLMYYKKSKKLIVKIFNIKKKLYNFENNNNYNINLYYSYYFFNLLKIPVLFNPINSKDIVSKNLINYVINSVKFISWKKYNIIHNNEIIETLFIALWLKNINLLIKWIRNYFEKANLKKHRKLFLLFNVLLGKLIWKYNIYLQLKGIRLSLRGKFGKAGSVRKTRKYIKKGKCSYTAKNLSLISKNTVIRTLTGVYSITLEVFF